MGSENSSVGRNETSSVARSCLRQSVSGVT